MNFTIKDYNGVESFGSILLISWMRQYWHKLLDIRHVEPIVVFPGWLVAGCCRK